MNTFDTLLSRSVRGKKEIALRQNHNGQNTSAAPYS